MKRKRVSLADRIRYASLLCLIWLLATFLIYLAFDMTVGIYMSSNPLHRPLMYATMVIAFAVVQRHLITRYLRLELRHWLRWTLLGVIASAICYQAFTAVAPAPSEFWWHTRISPPPAPEHLFAENAYHAIRYFFRFGLVAFFQYFALPRHPHARRLWLLAALIAAPLWHQYSLAAVIILALALDRVAFISWQTHFDSMKRKLSQPAIQIA